MSNLSLKDSERVEFGEIFLSHFLSNPQEGGQKMIYRKAKQSLISSELFSQLETLRLAFTANGKPETHPLR